MQVQASMTEGRAPYKAKEQPNYLSSILSGILGLGQTAVGVATANPALIAGGVGGMVDAGIDAAGKTDPNAAQLQGIGSKLGGLAGGVIGGVQKLPVPGAPQVNTSGVPIDLSGAPVQPMAPQQMFQGGDMFPAQSYGGGAPLPYNSNYRFDAFGNPLQPMPATYGYSQYLPRR